MSKKSFENKNPGSLDFIEISLNENNAMLKALIEETKNVSAKIAKMQENSSNVASKNSLDNMQERIDEKKRLSLQNDQKQIPNEIINSNQTTCDPVTIESTMSRAIIIKCENWEDFKKTASSAQKVSIALRESDKVFEVDALKGNQIVAYVGQIPELPQLLKAFLSGSLKVDDQNIFQGTLQKQ